MQRRVVDAARLEEKGADRIVTSGIGLIGPGSDETWTKGGVTVKSERERGL